MTFHITGPGEYRTKAGDLAVIVGAHPFAPDLLWIGIVKDQGFVVWEKSGRTSENIYSRYNIVSAWKEPVYVEGWVNVNVFGDKEPRHQFCWHGSKEEADAYCDQRIRVACRKIRWDGLKFIDVTGDEK